MGWIKWDIESIKGSGNNRGRGLADYKALERVVGGGARGVGGTISIEGNILE